MTWSDAPSASTPSWSASTSTTLTWPDNTQTTSNNTLGNFMRWIDADPLADGSGGVDFGTTFSTENPWLFTASANPITLSDSSFSRNDP